MPASRTGERGSARARAAGAGQVRAETTGGRSFSRCRASGVSTPTAPTRAGGGGACFARRAEHTHRGGGCTIARLAEPLPLVLLATAAGLAAPSPDLADRADLILAALVLAVG